MNVLHVTPYFYPAHVYGGPIPVLYDLCRHVANAGCSVRVLTTNANGPGTVLPNVPPDTEIELAQDLWVRYCSRSMLDSVSWSMGRVISSHVRWADVVHLSFVYSFPTIPVLAACRALQKPLIWSPLGGLQRWSGSRRVTLKQGWERACAAIAPANPTLYVTCDQEAAESLRAFPAFDHEVLPHGVPLPRKLDRIASEGPFRLLYLGRLDPKKGIENLLQACAGLDRLGPQDGLAPRYASWSLAIAGTGDQAYTGKLKAAVSRLGLSDKVRFLGEVLGDAKQELFAASDVLVVPSFTENFGMVVVEALAQMLPVIASTGTPWRRLEEVGCGLWVDNDPATLAGAIANMTRMPLADKGLAGRKWVEREFAWPVIAARTVELYRRKMRTAEPAEAVRSAASR